MFDITNISTMEQLIEKGMSQPLSHSKLHFHVAFEPKAGEKVIINYTSIIDKYYDFLSKIIVTVELTEEEFFKYKFQPKRLSFEKYGTVELWSSILRINNMTSATQFTNQRIKLFTEDIFDVLNEILILEETEIKENNFLVYGK